MIWLSDLTLIEHHCEVLIASTDFILHCKCPETSLTDPKPSSHFSSSSISFLQQFLLTLTQSYFWFMVSGSTTSQLISHLRKKDPTTSTRRNCKRSGLRKMKWTRNLATARHSMVPSWEDAADKCKVGADYAVKPRIIALLLARKRSNS
jgi:hypothetical protein